MKGYKGFTKDMKCRDKQYEVGKTYEEPSADMCHAGMHFCEHPLDCFDYYAPASSRFCEVDADDVSDQTDNDTKRCAKKLTIGVELNIKGLVDAAVKFVFDRADWSKKESSATGYHGAASATGYNGAASATGDHGAASATGDQAIAHADGIDSYAAGSIGNWLTLSEWARSDGYKWERVRCLAVRVDGERVKADVFYALVGGVVVEKKD